MGREKAIAPAEAQAQAQRAPLRLWLVVGSGDIAGPPAARLAAALEDMPQVDLDRVLAAPAAAPLPGPARAALALERRLVGLPPRPGRPGVLPRARPLSEVLATGNSAAPDLVVDLSGHPGVAALAARARHGLWRLDAFAPGGGLCAVAGGRPVTEVVLTQEDATGPGPRVLARAVYDTKPLMGRNAAYLREKSVQLVEQALRRLLAAGELPDLGPAPQPPRAPGASGVLGYAARVAVNGTGRIRQRIAARAGLRPRQFRLRVGPGTPLDFDPARLSEIVPEGNRYWADPFLFAHEGQTYLFFEDYDYRSRRGHISVGTVGADGFRLIGPALVRPHHLSYPFVFAHGGEIYMMPETCAARRLEVWRAVDFPTAWELHATALDGVAAVDSVLFSHGGEWWLFSNVNRDSFGDFCAELHLFRVSGPDLAWVEPHPLNPVVIGSDRARGGGRVFAAGGRLYRTAQDNSGGIYGYGLRIMEIVRLDASDYGEREVRRITPDFAPGLIGCHHMDAAAGQVVVDVRHA